jgi:ABC-2 type transport system permease protein
MIGTLHYEWIRLRSLRSTWLLSLAAVVVAVGLCWAFSTLIQGLQSSGTNVSPQETTIVLLTKSPMTLLVPAILGAIAACSDYRYGLVLATHSVEPRRWRAALMRSIVVATFAIGLVSACLLGAGGLAVLTLGGGVAITSVVSPLAVFVLLGAGWAVIGVSLGNIVRSQTVAVVLLVFWPYAVEPLVRVLLQSSPASWLHTVGGLLPAAAGEAAVRPSHAGASGLLNVSAQQPSPFTGALAFLLFVALTAAGAAALDRRRDAASG